MKASAWLVSLVAALMVSTGAHAQDKPNPLSGKRLYRAYCLVCHGADGKTRGSLAEKLNLAPADLSSAPYQTQEVQELAGLIGGYGRRAGSRMPRWSEVLGERDVRDIAAYLSKLSRPELRYQGNTRRGRAIFKSACVACHGKDGTGRGILARLIRIAMIDFTISENMKGMSDEELVKLIREGKGDYMPSWRGALSDDEITDVASYVRLLAR